MSEWADVTENMFKATPTFSLTKLLSDPTNLKYFKSLSVTDQPRERPALPLAPAEREKHVILCLAVPSADRATETVPLVTAMFTFIEGLTKINLRPETRSKMKKLREDVDREIREEAVKEKKEEAAEDKKAAKRKAEQERISRLSATDQKKVRLLLAGSTLFTMSASDLGPRAETCRETFTRQGGQKSIEHSIMVNSVHAKVYNVHSIYYFMDGIMKAMVVTWKRR
jgi:hypothetical protein